MGCFSSRVGVSTEERLSLGLSPPAAEHDAPTPADTASPTQPAAALPSATDLGVSERKLERWRELGGGDLEPVLASGAVALLDAQWIISHAEVRTGRLWRRRRAGGVLSHRQVLPKEAFLSLADLVEATNEYTLSVLPVAALSYPWLTKDHPDPRGANLARVARALKVLLNDQYVPRLGVFWDFGSLHQHPDPANGVMRTDEQNALFKQGLGCLSTLYSHPHTFVLRLTSFPDGHNVEDQAEGTNVAEYFDRGWCATENAWASLAKSGHLSLDLGKMLDGVEYDWGCLREDCVQGGGRRPPLLPSAFAAELEQKSFTNGKEDYPLVKRLYEAAFEEQFGKATVLGYGVLGWGDAEAAQLAEVLASGAAPRLAKLDLSDNKIGDEGCEALAAALGKEGAAPRLAKLDLSDNKIGDEGCEALAAALGKEGAAPRLELLDLKGNPISDEGCKALAAALKEGAAPSLKALYVDGQPAELAALFEEQGAAECKELVAVCEERGIKLPMQTELNVCVVTHTPELNYRGLGWGDAEAAQLAEVLASGAAPRLEKLSLGGNKIGDEGCKALAAALGKEGAAPRLEFLDLFGNPISDEGCKALAAALGKEGAAPRLKGLTLFNNKIGDEGCKALAAALGKEGAAPRLKWLTLGNKIGDEGCKALAAALGKEGAAPRLELLDLKGNPISDEGWKALAAALKEGAAPSLKDLLAPRVGSKQPELVSVCEDRGIRL